MVAYACLFFSANAPSTIGPLDATFKDAVIMVVFQKEELVEEALSPMFGCFSGKRRYQKSGTANGRMRRVLLQYHRSKYNRSHGAPPPKDPLIVVVSAVA